MKRFLKKPSGMVFVTCFVLFIILAVFAANNYTLPGDEAAGSWISGIDSSSFNMLMESVSDLGDTLPAAIIVITLIIVLLSFGRRLEAIFIAVLPLVGVVMNTSFKFLVDRPRPGNDPLGGGMSFPSVHTIFAVILFGFLFIIALRLIKNRRIAISVQVFSVVLILLMGVSRIYLEAHWLSDTLGSLLLGGVILALAFTIYDNYRSRRENMKVAGTA